MTLEMAKAKNFFVSNKDIGQNFLRDRTIAAWMAERAGLQTDGRVLEIGPGMGMLTEELLKTPCASVDAVELDTRLRDGMERLAESDGRLTLHWGDAVRFDYSKLESPPSHVVANIPYHITTPLLWRLIETFSGAGLRYMLLMVQKETAERLASGAGSRSSCPLGITLACLGEISIPRSVPRRAFSPMPRVESAIAEMVFQGEKRGYAGLPAVLALPRDKIWRGLLAGSFSNRRKTLVNNWAGSFRMPRGFASEILASRSLSALARPEELSLDDWLALRGDDRMAEFISRGVMPKITIESAVLKKDNGK
jgi:16S rRNA (adenine1518-N6/adenine1519-N6)-dimethyltransferase